MPTPYMLEHRRRPHAYDTYTGGVPCLSSFRFEIGDFAIKDESGNALLDSWFHPVFRQNVPQDIAKIVQMSDMAKKRTKFFLCHVRVQPARLCRFAVSAKNPRPKVRVELIHNVQCRIHNYFTLNEQNIGNKREL